MIPRVIAYCTANDDGCCGTSASATGETRDFRLGSVGIVDRMSRCTQERFNRSSNRLFGLALVRPRKVPKLKKSVLL